MVGEDIDLAETKQCGIDDCPSSRNLITMGRERGAGFERVEGIVEDLFLI